MKISNLIRPVNIESKSLRRINLLTITPITVTLLFTCFVLISIWELVTDLFKTVVDNYESFTSDIKYEWLSTGKLYVKLWRMEE